MRMYIFLLLLVSVCVNAQAQSPLTIEKCYERAHNNYPLIKQKQLIEQSKEYSIANVRSGYLPQISINAQATYQSDVTQVPIAAPGFDIEPLSKDQYKFYGEISQSLYDGGAIKGQKLLMETNARIDDQKLEVELYKIKERINQLFFGILLVDEQTAQIRLLQNDLERNITRVESAVRNGIAYKMSIDLLRAEYLKATQRIIETQSMRQAYVTMLGYFINLPLDDNTVFEKPVVLSFEDQPILTRPELTLFNYQSELLGAQYELGKTKTLPRVGLFLQGGYGKPALNMLKNEFDTYYLGGVRLNWSLSGFYNTKRDEQIRDLNLQQVNAQMETFEFNTTLLTTQQKQELNKLNKLIEVDDKIIALRTSIKTMAEAQQENGVITTNDYLRELNAEDQAKQNRLLHEMQLLMALYAYQNTIGN
ncbi:MAG: TolC family protein [Cyclobacteriaceae bacterium]|nr:TolC family protein [Cyclobacteriaceae bacterium]